MSFYRLFTLILFINTVITNSALANAEVEFWKGVINNHSIEEGLLLDSAIAPEFPYNGGWEAMIEFVNKNFQYPKKSLKNGIEGDILIQVIVKKDGSVTDYRLAQGIPGGEDLNDEAMRVAKLLKFMPPNSTNPDGSLSLIVPFKLRIEGNDNRPTWIFPEGDDSLRKFIRQNLVYPIDELHNEVTTFVLVKVFVGVEGQALETSTEVVYGDNKKSFKTAAKDVAGKIDRFKWVGKSKTREKGYILFYVMFDELAREKAQKEQMKGN